LEEPPLLEEPLVEDSLLALFFFKSPCGRAIFGKGSFERDTSFERDSCGRLFLGRALCSRLCWQSPFGTGVFGINMFARGMFARGIFGKCMFARGMFGKCMFQRHSFVGHKGFWISIF
jgi:hypothetical protein